MNCTQKELWDAVEVFTPSIVKAKNEGVSMNLPKCLELAAVEVFMICETSVFKKDFSQLVAAETIRQALLELRSIGWMTFSS